MTSVTTIIVVFLYVTPCGLAEVYRTSRERCSLSLVYHDDGGCRLFCKAVKILPVHTSSHSTTRKL